MSNQTSCFVKMVKEICQEENISFISFSSDFMFRLERNGKVNYIFGYQFGLNSASAHMICEDKSTLSELLTFAGIPNVEHRCFMSPMNMKYVQVNGNWNEMLFMLDQYQTLVLKDNKGTGGLAVYKVSNAVELENAAQILFQSAHSISVSPYYDIIKEYRVIILDGNVKLIYHKNRKYIIGDGIHTIRELYAKLLLQKPQEQRHYPVYEITAEDADRIPALGESYPLHWKHNLGQGAYPVLDTDISQTASLQELAKKAAACVGIRFASIDIVQIPMYSKHQKNDNQKTEHRILEINSGVMMEYFSKANMEYQKIAKEIYREAILKMME